MRLRILLGCALLAGACAPRVPPAPAITMAPMPIDRETLPDVTLRQAIVASTRMSRHLAVHGGEKTDERGPIHVFVLSHPTQGTVLIDTGYGRRSAADPHDHPGRIVTTLFELEMHTPIADLLPDIGVEPEAVEQIVLTHLHDDHAAGAEDFPDAVLWTGYRDALFADRKRLTQGIDPAPFASHTQRHPTFSHGAWGPFEAHTDLFGDGTVLLFPAPGHTPGSLLVLVNTPEHSWLLLGDAAWTDDNWKPSVRPKSWPVRTIVEHDWKRGTDVLYRVRELIGDDRLTLVSGHEPANATRLAAWPEPMRPPGSTDSSSER